MKNLKNLIEIAATLVVEGKATVENAIEKAIELDNQMCENTLGVLNNQRGYNFINSNNIVPTKGLQIVKKSLYERFNK
jgi:hypothetical protein